jgi:hypothetical protein
LVCAPASILFGHGLDCKFLPGNELPANIINEIYRFVQIYATKEAVKRTTACHPFFFMSAQSRLAVFSQKAQQAKTDL